MTADGAPHTKVAIGTEATCSDAVCGTVTQVVVDPALRAVTHLVVEPRHRSGLGRLVPLDLLDPESSEIRLHCTVAQFDELEAAEETHFLPGSNAYGDYGPAQTLLWPHYGLGPAGGEPVSDVDGQSPSTGPVGESVTSDILPAGEVAIRRGDKVHAVDGDIGRVQGLVIGEPGHHITHVLLQEGHLFGRKDVAIPTSAVTGIGREVELSLTKQEVRDLPPIEFAYLPE